MFVCMCVSVFIHLCVCVRVCVCALLFCMCVCGGEKGYPVWVSFFVIFINKIGLFFCKLCFI